MKRQWMPKYRLLCMILACCMLATVCVPMGTLVALAANDSQAVAKVGNTEYKDYRQAWDAVKNGGEITMLADWHITEMLTVVEDRYITVHMNGHMINRGLTESDDDGAIFLVEEDGFLMLKGNGVQDTEHWGSVDNGKWRYREDGLGNVKINGSLLTGGYNEDGGGAIHIEENADVRLDGVTVAGNASDDDDMGGAIHLEGDDAKLYIINSTISYNRSDDGGGAAIWVEGEDSLVEIKDSWIHHNLVTVEYGDGGAIQINNGRVELKNSNVSFNEAGRNGGAVYVYNGNLVIDENTVLSYNVANLEGGAVYVDSGADEVKLSGHYVGNRSTEEGGAVYVNSDISGHKGVRISNAEMLGNLAGARGGGAVYVDSDDEIGLSGRVIMQGNSPDNLHLRHEEGIMENTLTADSRIGIFTYWEATEDYYPVETGNSACFFSDKVGYEIKGSQDRLYFVEGSRGAPSDYKVGNTAYDMIKSSLDFTSKQGGTMTTHFYYSDGYFAEDPKYYNEHFASFAAGMALAAMPAVFEGDYTEDKVAAYIVNLFVATGFSDIFVHYPQPAYYGKDAENYTTIGYAIAKKTTVINGKETTVIATAVRGADYGSEWISNMTLGSGIGEAFGFGDAARQVKQGIDAYIAREGIDTDSAKFLITGYSRAGATSNLVAKKLTDTYGEDQVYAYCFEAPQGGAFSEWKKGATYANIHNCINAVDIVTMVGTEQMGFLRYGVDHMVPGNMVDTDLYNAQKNLMLAQLAEINENILVKDKFHEATVEYVLYYFGMSDLINTLSSVNKDFYYAEDWVPYFIEQIQKYSFTAPDNESASGDHASIFDNESDEWYGYRNFYANYTWYLYFDEKDQNNIKINSYITQPEDFDNGTYMALTLEEAIGNLALFFFGSSAEKKSAMIGAIDPKAIMERLDMKNIYMEIVDEWHIYSLDEKNQEFNALWDALGLESSLKNVMTEEELKALIPSFYVVADVLLDFVAEDYHHTAQNILGTLVHNISNILQTHNHDINYAWIRSYDSFYSDIQYTCTHSYGEWRVVKEASTEDYGVQVKVCERCEEELYEAIPKIVPDVKFPASLFGEGSLIAVVFATITTVAVGVAVYFYVRLKKETESVQDDG